MVGLEPQALCLGQWCTLGVLLHAEICHTWGESEWMWYALWHQSQVWQEGGCRQVFRELPHQLSQVRYLPSVHNTLLPATAVSLCLGLPICLSNDTFLMTINHPVQDFRAYSQKCSQCGVLDIQLHRRRVYMCI